MHNEVSNEKEKKKKIIILVILLCVVFISLICSVLFLFNSDKGKSDSKKDNSTTVIKKNTDKDDKDKDDSDKKEIKPSDDDSDGDEELTYEDEDEDNSEESTKGNSSYIPPVPEIPNWPGNKTPGIPTLPDLPEKNPEITNPENPGGNEGESSGGETEQKPGGETNPTEPVDPPVEKRFCEEFEGKFYDKDGKEVEEAEYKKSCGIPEEPEKHYCEEVDGVYYDKEGNEVSYDDYNKSCNGSVEPPVEEEKTPSKPVILSQVITTSSITVNFEKSTNANSYTCSVGSKEGVVINTSDGNLQCNVSGLEEGTNYILTIKAINKEKSSMTEVNFQTKFKAPGKPVLISSNSTDKSVSANFGLVENAKNYICLYKEASEKDYKTKSASVLQDSVYCEVDGLEQHTEYNVALKAINGNAETYSEATDITTRWSIPNTPAVSNVEVTETTITVEIGKMSNTTNMTCYYGSSEADMSNEGDVFKNEDGTYSCEMEGLTPDTTYYIKITANNHGEKASNTITIKTNEEAPKEQAPGKPVLAHSEVLSNYAKAVYSAVENGKTYKCNIEKEMGKITSFDAKKTGEGIVCEYEGLTEDTEYTTYLTVVNETLSNQSDNFIFTTKILEMDKPNFVKKSSTDSEIKATFGKVTNAEDYTCYYGTNEAELSLTGTVSEDSDGVNCSVTGLEQNTKYYLKLTATRKGTTIESDVINITTEYSTPGIPVLETIDKTINSARVTYSKPAHTTNAVCYYGTSRSNLSNSVVANVAGDKVICDITDIDRTNNTYYVKAKVFNNDVKSNESVISTIEAEQQVQPQEPDAPTAITYLTHSMDFLQNKLSVTYGPATNKEYTYKCNLDSVGDDTTNLRNVEPEIVERGDMYYVKCSFDNIQEGSSNTAWVETEYKGKTATSEKTTIPAGYKTPEKPQYNDLSVIGKTATVHYSNVNERYNYVCNYGTSLDSLSSSGIVSVSGNTATCTLNNLTENSYYYVKLTAINHTESTSSDTTGFRTDALVPTKPELIPGSINTTASTIDAYFTKSQNANTYACYYGTDSLNPTTLGVARIENDKIHCSFSQLEQNTQYFFRLIVSNDGGSSAMSEISSAITQTEVPTPPIYRSYTETGRTISAQYVVTSKYQSAKCYYGVNRDSLTNIGDVVTLPNSTTVLCNATGLDENSTYYFKLQIFNGPFDASSTVQELHTTWAPPEKPIYLGSTYANNEFTVRFTESRDAERMTCYYGTSPEEMTNTTSPNFINDEARCIIPNITKGTKYYVKLRANRKTVYTDSDIEIVSVEAPKAEAPTFVSSLSGPGMFSSIWQLNGYYTGHKCYYKPSGESSWTEGVTSLYGRQVRCTGFNLRGSQMYDVKLVSINDQDQKETVVNITTDATVGGTCDIPGRESVRNDLAVGNTTRTISVYSAESGCSVDSESEAYKKAYDLAVEISSMEVTKLLEDIPALANSTDYANLVPVRTNDGRIAGFAIHVTIYGSSWDDFQGEYYLREDGTRDWVFKNFSE